MSCPSNEELERFALGFSDDPRAAQKHVEGCDPCAARLGRVKEDHEALSRAARAVKLPRVGSSRRGVWKPLAVAAALVLAAIGGVMVLRQPSSEPPQWKDKLVKEANYTYTLRSRESAEILERDTPEVAQFGGNDGSTYDLGLSNVGGTAHGGKERRSLLADVEKARAPADMFFKGHGVNPEIDTAKQTQSTFALDVDTASYTVVRNYLRRGQLPPPEAVRVEEFLNYFRYHDDPPPAGTFAIRLEAAPSPFDKDRRILRIGIKAKEIKDKDRKDVVLTFVIDVSGSMAQENRLELVKKSLRFLVERLRPTDRIGIAVYGSYARKLLDPAPVAKKDTILAIIDDLRPDGSTNVAAGLKVAYETAAAAFDPAATNRVVLCSDGVANNGDTSPESMLDSISKDASKGIYLSCLGFGMGNYNDTLMEKLANSGNGNYAYVDDFAEAKKIFSEKLAGMMEVVAADAKVQAEFNAETVASFRLVGYENRHIANEDFRNDKVDAGEIGAGHHVTALYEFALKPGARGQVVTVRIRYKEPDTKEVPEAQHSIGVPQVLADVKDASPSWRLAVAVMQFAEILRGSDRAKDVTLAQVVEQAEKAALEMDKPADATELVELVKAAASLRQ